MFPVSRLPLTELIPGHLATNTQNSMKYCHLDKEMPVNNSQNNINHNFMLCLVDKMYILLKS